MNNFILAETFNQPLDNWDVSNVETMDSMLMEATGFNQPLDKWNVSKVCGMNEMFRESKKFSHYPAKWTLIQNASTNDMFVDSKAESQAQKKPLKKSGQTLCPDQYKKPPQTTLHYTCTHSEIRTNACQTRSISCMLNFRRRATAFKPG